MRYRILQLPTDDDLCFMDFDYCRKKEPNVKELLSRYNVVYEGELESDKSDYEFLEKLFFILNMEHPEDYRTRSLSVSDIVEFDDRYWFCDSFGFEELN